MTTVMTNPSKPINPKPIAEILDTALNSSLVGFLSKCQTLTHWPIKEDNFSLISIDIKDIWAF